MKGYLPGGLPGPLMGKPGRGSRAQRKAAFDRAVRRKQKRDLRKTINAVSK